jgi:hypothetical protein
MGAVKFAVCQPRLVTADAAADSHSDLAATAGVSSITFGEDVVYFGIGTSWDQFRDGAGRAVPASPSANIRKLSSVRTCMSLCRRGGFSSSSIPKCRFSSIRAASF